MFNSRKIKNIILIILFFLLLLSVKSVAVVSPTKDFFVNDYAKVLTEETKDFIIKTNVELQQKTGTQIVVATVNSLEGKSIEEYANELFRKFEIGDSEKNNGVLLLCSTGERLFRIEVGNGLGGILTDGKTGRIQDQYITPYLKDNNYDEGIRNGFSVIIQEITKEYNITISNIEVANKVDDTSETEEYSFSFYMIAFLNFFIVLCICIAKFKDLSIRINKFKIIYMCILAIIGAIFTKSFIETILLLIINIVSYLFIYFVAKGNSNGYYDDFGGSSSGRGFSGGGGSSDGGGSTRSF